MYVFCFHCCCLFVLFSSLSCAHRRCATEAANSEQQRTTERPSIAVYEGVNHQWSLIITYIHTYTPILFLMFHRFTSRVFASASRLPAAAIVRPHIVAQAQAPTVHNHISPPSLFLTSIIPARRLLAPRPLPSSSVALPLPSSPSLSLDSVKRKRARKMNRHKYKRRLKRERMVSRKSSTQKVKEPEKVKAKANTGYVKK